MLGELYSGAHEDWLAREALVPRDQLEIRASIQSAPLDVLGVLAPRERIHIIGEIKRRAPPRALWPKSLTPWNLLELMNQVARARLAC